MLEWFCFCPGFKVCNVRLVTSCQLHVSVSAALSTANLLLQRSAVNVSGVMYWRVLWDSAGTVLVSLMLSLTVPVPAGCEQRNGRVLRVTTVLLEPYMMAQYTYGPGNVTTGVTYVGYVADLIRKLSEVVGFRYELYVVPDNQYGFRHPDGTWNGMVKELLAKNADVAAGAMLVTSQRKEVVEFTHPFLNVHATLLLRKPPAGELPRIRHVTDLINQSETSFGTLARGIIPKTFKKTNNSSLKLLWKQMSLSDESVFTATNEQGIARARRENYAFVIQDTIGDYIAMREPCDLMTVDKFLFRQSYALALRTDSVWLPLFNRGLQMLKRGDVFNSLYRKWWMQKSTCQTQNPSRSISLAATSSGSRGTINLLVFIVVVLVSHYGVVNYFCNHT